MTKEEVTGIGWWLKISENPSQAFAEDSAEVERTKPLSSVVELRNFATDVNLLQYKNFSDEDKENGVVSVLIEKDQIFQLSQEIQRHLELEEFIPVGEKAEVFVSTSTRNLFLGVLSDDRRITFSFNSKVSYLTIKLECFEDGVWVIGEEKPLDDYGDPKIVLDLFQSQLI